MADAIPELWRAIVCMTVDVVHQKAECLRGTPEAPHMPTCVWYVHRCFLDCVRAVNGNRVWPSIEHIVAWIARTFPRAKAQEHSVTRAVAFLEAIGAVRKITDVVELGNGPGAYQFPVEQRRAQGLGQTTPTYDLAGSFELLPETYQAMIEARAVAMGLSPEQGNTLAKLPPAALAEPSPETLPKEERKTQGADSSASTPPASETVPNSPPASSIETFPQSPARQEIPSEVPSDPFPPPSKERSLKIEQPGNSQKATKPPGAAASRSQIWQGDIEASARARVREGQAEAEGAKAVAEAAEGVVGDDDGASSARQSPRQPSTPAVSPEAEAERAAKETARLAEKRMRHDVARLQALVEANRSSHPDEKPLWPGPARNLLAVVTFAQCEEGIAYLKWVKRKGTLIKNFGGYFQTTMWTAIAARDLKGSTMLPPWPDGFDEEVKKQNARLVRVRETAEAAERVRVEAANTPKAEMARPLAIPAYLPELTGPRTLVAVWPTFINLLSKRLPRLLVASAVLEGKLQPMAWNEETLSATLSCRSDLGRHQLQSSQTGGILHSTIVGETLRDALGLPYATTVRVRFVESGVGTSADNGDDNRSGGSHESDRFGQYGDEESSQEKRGGYCGED